MLTFGLLAFSAAPAHAVTVVLGTGTLDATDPTFTRPAQGTPPTFLASGSYKYDLLPFTISTSGLWTILARGNSTGGGTLGDPWLVIYENAFDPTSPLTNVLGSDDDSGVGVDSSIVLNLTSTTNYFAVITTFSSGATGTYTLEQQDPPTPPAPPPPLAATHWLGQTSSLWSAANWASDAAGTATAATPTSTDNITFAATGAAAPITITFAAPPAVGAPITITNLDRDFTINSLTVNSNTGIYTDPTPAQTLTVNTTTTVNALLYINNGVTLQNNGNLTVSGTGTLAGDGAVTAAVDQSIFINGTLGAQRIIFPSGTFIAGDAILAPGVLSLTTSGTGAVVMGAGSFIAVDLFTGAAVGDNTGLAISSDRLDLTGNLDATAGGTLVIGNPYGMSGFAGGDQWLVADLNGGAGTITGTLALNDSALALTPTQVGNFDKTTGVYKIIDTITGLEITNVQDQSIMSGIQGILGDINGRLFNLRAGSGEEPQGSISDSLSGGIDHGVIVGQGDGPDQSIAKKTPLSRQWEVFTTVNYANISLNTIGNQAGVDSQTWAPGVGIERHFSRHLTLGFAANLLETNQSYANNLGSMDMQGIALSAYASYVQRSFWMDLLYSWGTFDLDTDRNAPGFPVANGETNALTNAVQLNGGWSFRIPAWKLVHGPIAGLDWLHVNVDGYSETGGGIGALTYGTRSMDSLVTRVGWSVTREFDASFAKITPQLRLTYERQNIDRNNGTSVNVINQPFTATTTNQTPGQDYVVGGAGVNFEFSPDFSMLIAYQGQFFRENMQAHYGSMRFTYKF